MKNGKWEKITEVEFNEANAIETPEQKRERLLKKKAEIEAQKAADEITRIKKQTFEERKKELGNDSAKGYIEIEGDVGAKIEARYGYFRRSTNADVEWYSLSGPYAGKSFDLIGLEPGVSTKIPDNMKDFIVSLDEHIIKADVVVLDYRFMNQNQIISVETHLRVKNIQEGANFVIIRSESDLLK